MGHGVTSHIRSHGWSATRRRLRRHPASGNQQNSLGPIGLHRDQLIALFFRCCLACQATINLSRALTSIRLQASAAVLSQKSRDCDESHIKPLILRPIHPPITVAMASRRLALNLAQGIRSRAAAPALSSLKRGFATPVSSPAGAKTQTTTLKNGLTVSRPRRPIGLVTLKNSCI
jgi:hypothetical protein